MSRVLQLCTLKKSPSILIVKNYRIVRVFLQGSSGTVSSLIFLVIFASCFSYSSFCYLNNIFLHTHTHKLLFLWRRCIQQKGTEFECYSLYQVPSWGTWKQRLFLRTGDMTVLPHWFAGWFTLGLVRLVTREEEKVGWPLEVLSSVRAQILAGEHGL